MTVWLWIALVSAVIYWSIFFYLLRRRRWDAASLTVGVLHMLFAMISMVAPIRALIDPDYVGYQLGLIRFEGWTVALPAATFLAWGLAAAWIAVAKGRGRWMQLIAVGDILFALNLGGAFLLDLLRGDLANFKIQGGEHFTLTGAAAALIPLFLFALPFVVSAVWAARRSRSNGATPPFAHAVKERRKNSESDEGDTKNLRYAGNHV